MPSPFTIEMIASEMPAAIRPYSIAVAPDSVGEEFLQDVFHGRTSLHALERIAEVIANRVPARGRARSTR